MCRGWRPARSAGCSRGRWDTTVANAWGSLAMRAFSRRFESQPVDGTTTVALGAGDAASWRGARRARPAVDLPWTGDAKVPLRVDHHGQGRPWASIQSRAAIPLDGAGQRGAHREALGRAGRAAEAGDLDAR